MSILCYHAVDPGWTSPLAVTPAAFEEHCAWLVRHRTVVPLDVALDHLDGRGRLPGGMVAMTFDDGFRQLSDLVFPSLLKHGLPATVFVVAATLTKDGHPVDWVDTPPSWELHTLTARQITEAPSDLVSFSSHSWSHRTLTELEHAECERELRDSRLFLEDLLRKPVRHVAYPRGRHDDLVRQATRRAGYSYGLALPQAREQPGPYAVPRAGIFPGNGTGALRLKTWRSYQALRQSRAFPMTRSIVKRN